MSLFLNLRMWLLPQVARSRALPNKSFDVCAQWLRPVTVLMISDGYLCLSDPQLPFLLPGDECPPVMGNPGHLPTRAPYANLNVVTHVATHKHMCTGSHSCNCWTHENLRGLWTCPERLKPRGRIHSSVNRHGNHNLLLWQRAYGFWQALRVGIMT